MIKLQDTIIQTDTQSVLDRLKFDLAQHGVDRFHQFRRNGDRKEYDNDWDLEINRKFSLLWS